MRAFRKWNKAGMISFALIFPAIFLRGALDHVAAFAGLPAMVPLVVCIAVFAYFLARILLFRCPRCGGLFSMSFRPYNKPTGRNCGQCGLSADV